MSTTTMGRAARSDKAAKPGKTPKAGAQSAIQGQGRVGKVFGYAAMVAVLLVIAVPLFWIVVTSFKAHDHIYVRPAEGVPAEFHNIGIRIEDDAIVTETGCELISRGVPVTVSEIEALMRG